MTTVNCLTEVQVSVLSASGTTIVGEATIDGCLELLTLEASAETTVEVARRLASGERPVLITTNIMLAREV